MTLGPKSANVAAAKEPSNQGDIVNILFSDLPILNLIGTTDDPAAMETMLRKVVGGADFTGYAVVSGEKRSIRLLFTELTERLIEKGAVLLPPVQWSARRMAEEVCRLGMFEARYDPPEPRCESSRKGWNVYEASSFLGVTAVAVFTNWV